MDVDYLFLGAVLREQLIEGVLYPSARGEPVLQPVVDQVQVPTLQSGPRGCFSFCLKSRPLSS